MPSRDRIRVPRLRLRWGRIAAVLCLVAVTVVVAVLAFGRGDEPAAPPVAGSSTSSGTAPTPGSPAASGTSPTPTGQDGTDGDLTVGPMPTQVPRSGDGKRTVLDVPGVDSTRSGRTVRYTVETEGGLGVSPAYFAGKVREVLTDARGWEPKDGVHFVNVSPAQRAAGAETDIHIILASPAMVDEMCAPLETGGRLSCHNHGNVMLNVDRWVHGAETYGDDVTTYRIYQISHEVGHSIGHGHVTCPGPGQAAPVMVQQTKALFGCRAWPWPQRPAS